MTFRVIEVVSPAPPLSAAIEQAFAQLRTYGETHAALMFDISWQPTMEVVDLIARESGAGAFEPLNS